MKAATLWVVVLGCVLATTAAGTEVDPFSDEGLYLSCTGRDAHYRGSLASPNAKVRKLGRSIGLLKCANYLAGLTDMNDWVAERGGAPEFCVPAGTVGAELAATYARWFEAHAPATVRLGRRSAAINALARTYPCDR